MAKAGDLVADDTTAHLAVTGGIEVADATIGVETGGARDAVQLTYPHVSTGAYFLYIICGKSRF